jgi:serine/threonine-protein kinase
MSQAPDLSKELAPEFEVLRTLGQGAMGTVYLAREVDLRRLVAIKVPRPELAEDEEVRARLEREARAAARIIHPGAATVYRTGKLEDTTPYLVMEYVEGRTMNDVIAADGPFDMETGLSILEQVAAALAAAHATGVVHRDVRPGNVIWNPSTQRAVLTDFGIAGILETGSETVTRITRVGQTLGKVGFTSPEQLMGEEVTEATDIYSLGILAHHILTGEGPYDISSKVQMVQAHMKGAPRPLKNRIPNMDPRVDSLITACLAKTPAQRPLAERVRATLAEIRTGGGKRSDQAAGEESDSPLPPALREFVREVRRRRVGGVAVGYLALSFVVLQLWDPIVGTIQLLLPLTEAQATATLLFLLAGGFPLALVIAWLYDLTARGLERTKAETTSPSKGPQLVLKIAAIVMSLVVFAALVWLTLAIR